MSSEFYLRPELKYARGPAGAALYDLRHGAVYAVPLSLVATLDDHLQHHRPLLPGPGTMAWGSWVDTLKQQGLLTVDATATSPAAMHADNREGLKFLWLEITGRCNWTCIHCYAESDPEPHPTMPDARWLALIEEAAKAGFPGIQFVGGDPFMHPSLMHFVEHAHRQNIDLVEVYTNGSMIQPRHMDVFAARGTHLAISFYSHQPDIAAAITGNVDGWQRTVEAIPQILKREIPLRIGLINMEQNRDHLPETIQFLLDLGVDPGRIRSDGVRPSGRGMALQAQGCGQNPGTAAPLISPERITRQDAPRPVPIWQSPMPRPRTFPVLDDSATWNSCWQGELVVDPAGDLFPCIFTRDTALGNVANTRLGDLLGTQDIRTKWETNLGDCHDCEVCEYRFACFDCRALTVNLTGELKAKPPSCIYDPMTAKMNWERWYDQCNPDEIHGLHLYRAAEFKVVAETEDHVTIGAPDQHWIAELDFATASVLDNAQNRSIREIAYMFAETAGGNPDKWLRGVTISAWSLQELGLLELHTPIHQPA